MEKDRLSQKKFQWNTEIMFTVGGILLFIGGIIFGAIITDNGIVLPVIIVIIIATLITTITGIFLIVKSSYIEKLNAIGKPTTSIESIDIGEKYKVISTATSDESEFDDKRKVYLLLQKENTENVFFYQRTKGEKPILLPKTGDTIILITDEFIIRKNQKE